jgi:hypothetical protein
MDKTSPSQERFAELIWRTVKLRVSLLVVSAVLLLVTWLGLTNGNAEAQKLDMEFCNHLESETAKALSNLWPQAYKTTDRIPVCTPQGARLFIESGRAFDAVLPLEGDAFSKKKAELAEYDQKRRAAYKLEIGLSSEGAESKVIVNALSVAEVVPFVVVLILSIVVVLGFQQNAYRRLLRSLLNDTKSGEELNHGIASSQFLSGFDISSPADVGTWMVLSPEGTAIWVLLTAVSYLLLAVLAAFVINLIHITNSIFLNYLFALYALIFLLAVALWRTRIKYQAHPEKRPKKTSRLLAIARWFHSPWGACSLAATAVFSIFLPWTTSGLKGYRFVLRQKPLSQSYGHSQYPVDPRLFFEIRCSLVLVGLFLASCVISSISERRAKTVWTKTLRRVNWLFALTTLFLTLNYLLYMGTLEYLSLTDTDFSYAWLLGSLNKDGGYPMSLYDPAYGFVVLLFCCLTLSWSSLHHRDSNT